MEPRTLPTFVFRYGAQPAIAMPAAFDKFGVPVVVAFAATRIMRLRPRVPFDHIPEHHQRNATFPSRNGASKGNVRAVDRRGLQALMDLHPRPLDPYLLAVQSWLEGVVFPRLDAAGIPPSAAAEEGTPDRPAPGPADNVPAGKEIVRAVEMVSFPQAGDQIETIRDRDGRGHVVIKRICENIGLNYSGQLEKLKSRSWSGVWLCHTPDERGSLQEQNVIPVDRIPMWMANINENKVAPGIRSKVVLYQSEAADVLARHFLGTREAPAPAASTPIDPGMMAAFQAMAAAIIQPFAAELQAIRQDQQRLARGGGLSGPAVLSYVPAGYYRFTKWLELKDIPVAAMNLKLEIREAKNISYHRNIEVHRCKPDGRQDAYYFHESILMEWERGFRQKNPIWSTKPFPFRENGADQGQPRKPATS